MLLMKKGQALISLFGRLVDEAGFLLGRNQPEVHQVVGRMGDTTDEPTMVREVRRITGQLDELCTTVAVGGDRQT